MINKIKLPCGIDKDGNIVYIKDAIKGQNCGCFCPGCKQPLVAKKGDIREQHFAHKSKDYDCEHGFQSALHYMAKDIFMELEYITFIKNGSPVKYKIDSVQLECKVDEIIPDIIVNCDGKHFIRAEGSIPRRSASK
jgi:competence CoiA-like predicted nuclease